MEHESSPTRVALTLSEDECMLHRGPLAHKGKLSLSEAALTFEPSGTLDRLAGVRPVTIPVDSITDSTSGEGNHKVQVSTEGNVHHFSGRGAVRVQERLAALMAERAGTEDARFAAGEVVLVQGRATLFVNALMAVRGELTLTTQRFRFVPQLGVDQILWDPAGLDVTVDEISAFELLGVRGRLRLDIGGQSHIFGGSLASSVYTHLEILQGHDLDSSAFAVLDTWPVQLRSGPIAHPGELAIRPQQLLFSPQGTIDTLVGVRELAIDLERIDRLRVTGRIDQHLEIHTGDRSHAFYSAAPQDRMWFLAAVVRRHLEQASERGEPGVASVEETIAAWSSVLDIDPTEERLFCSPAGSIEKSNEVLFGWLVLTPTQVMFLPLRPPDPEQTGVFIAPVDSICRADREPQDQLVILADGVGHSFLVSDSSGGADAFWANSSSPERILVWDRLSPSIDAHLHGECRYVQITAGEEVLAELEPGLLLKRDEGVGVLAPSFLARSIPVGDMVTVEIGHPAVVYQFDSEVVGWQEPDDTESELDLRGTVVLQVGAPTALRVYNRRESFRVETERVVQATLLSWDDEDGWVSAGEAFTGTLLDFSIGGCRFQTVTALNHGDRVQLMMPLADKPLTVHAVCLRHNEANGDPSGAIYGLEFQGLSVAQEDRIHRSVMALERMKPREQDDEDAPEELALPSELQVALTFLQSQPREVRALFSEKVLSLIDD